VISEEAKESRTLLIIPKQFRVRAHVTPIMKLKAGVRRGYYYYYLNELQVIIQSYARDCIWNKICIACCAAGIGWRLRRRLSVYIYMCRVWTHTIKQTDVKVLRK